MVDPVGSPALIEEVMNREFVLGFMREALAELEAPADDRRSGELPPGVEDVGDHDLAAARRELAGALSREEQQTSGQVTSQPEGEARRSAADASLDDAVFISRDAVTSVFQSALEEYLETAHPDALATPAPDDRRSADGAVAPLTDRSLGLVDEDRRLFGRFEQTDIRWVNSLFAMGVRKLRGRQPFNETPAEPVRIAKGARLRLLLMGDWGTGLPRARRVAELMRDELERGRQDGVEQHVVHLGDVYYSGWAKEYEKRVLPHWPVDHADADTVGSWSLNGNHDMYSGGKGYYEVLLGDPRFARQQQSSFFSIETDDWKVLGLDTAYDDHGLRDPQPQWARSHMEEGSHRILLLSHHQLFSTDPDKGGPKLRTALADVLRSGQVTSWFWGHEHRCATFEPHEGVGRAACIGHGGVPLYNFHEETDTPLPPAKYEYFASIDTGPERWTRMGFAVLDFVGPSVAVRFVDELGVEHHTEEIS